MRRDDDRTRSPAGHLAAGTRFATPYYVEEGEQPGPTVLVIGGTHGNEPASARAATRLLDWTVLRGRLVVVPELNRPALAARTRHTPGARFADLNRNFPSKAHGVRGELAPLLWRFAQALEPDWVLDLHEGWGFHRTTPESVGSSVTYVAQAPSGAAAREQARRVLASINATIDAPRRQMDLITPGPAGSFARSVSSELGIPSLVLETTRTGQPLWRRVSQQLLMVQTVLADLDMVVLRPWQLARFHQRCLCPGPP